ncbi:hypothetical protein [Aliiglaciecola sp. M165]|uniref:hypothetical protein n=1 Tax=Aliiglaciecola sp. M165 TaxID=2593649 RepID=UPI00117FCE4D|nr:hypothetical protein [Aliiglaciecola sp. M165]TRY33410.1 hypothetical protein FM019_05395 [Aliiglaciecola sp. M165]
MRFFLFFIFLLKSFVVLAEPTGERTDVIRLRAFAEGDGAIYVYVSTQNYLCETSTFSINLSRPGSQEMHALLTTALVSGKQVRLELRDNQCNGWGTEIRSVYLEK